METVGKSQQQRCGLSKMIHGHMQIIILIIKELTFYRNYSVSLHCHEYMICDLIHIYKEYIIFRGKKNDTIAGQYCANHLIGYLYYKIFQVGCCSLQCPVRLVLFTILQDLFSLGAKRLLYRLQQTTSKIL